MPADLHAASADHETKLTISEEALTSTHAKVVQGSAHASAKLYIRCPMTIDDKPVHQEFDVHQVTINQTVEEGETAPGSRYEDETIIIPIFEKVLVVERRMKLKEELPITRTCREEPFVQIETLKSEQVSVERFDEHRLS